MDWESSYTESQSTNTAESLETSSQIESISSVLTSSSEILQFPLTPTTLTSQKSCQTEECTETVVIDQKMYEELVSKSAAAFDLKEEISMLRNKCFDLFGEEGNPEMDPNKFESICKEAGAETEYFNLFSIPSVLKECLIAVGH